MKTTIRPSVMGLIVICLTMGTLACGAGFNSLAGNNMNGGGSTASTPGTGAATPTTSPTTTASPAPTPTPTPTPTPAPVPPAPVTTPAPAPEPPATPTPASSGLPTPPANAKTFQHLEEATGWGTCNTAACAGGNGGGSPWMAQNQTAPSIDGSSMELNHSGVWANALWWKHVGANNNATNFLWDFYVQLDQASLTNAQTLEYDAFQFVGGYNYMIGSQCNYAAKVWDTWDELNGRWEHTTVPCPKFTPGVWHHIQWYVQRVPNSHNYSYVTLVVDDKSYPVNRSYSAKNLGWADNAGVQYQLDVNATGGAYQEWVDKSTLTIW